MTKRDWMSVGLKCAFLAVFLMVFVQFVAYSTGIVQMLVSGAHPAEMWSALVGLSMGCAVALVGLRFSDVLAAKTVPADAPWAPGEVHRVVFLLACRVAGAVCAVMVVSDILPLVGYWSRMDLSGEFFPRPIAFIFAQTAWLVVRGGMACYLLFGGRSLVRIAFASGDHGVSSVDAEPEILGIGRPNDVFSLALRVVGLIFLLGRLPKLIEDLVLRVFPLFHEGGMTAPGWPRFIWALVMVAVCLYLLTGARALVRLVFRPRPSNLPDAP